MRKKLLRHFALLLLLLFSNSSGNSASPAAQGALGVFNPGPDIIAGNMSDLDQFGAVGTQRGLATAITSCNTGNEFVGFFAMPNTDHPAVAQNLYRMSGGSGNNDRFEQIGQSWVKHTYGAKQANGCNFGCLPGGDFTHLGVGCSDTYFNFQSAEQGDLGSRAWINPFTGVFSANARDHTGHNHTAVSHMMVVESNDLNQTINPGATYYAELVYVTPNEYTWCQAHPAECNMFNNASYLQYNVSGTTNFSFSQVGLPVRMTPAINAWSGATIRTIEPEPGGDGRAYLAYKVTGPVGGLYHYEYAIYNQNLDRGIQSFSVPRLLLPGINGAELPELNVEFHGPPQHPGFPADGTEGDAGFSSAEWTFTPGALSLTWSSETFAQNQNANAIRWGTLYNFRFDSTTEPAASNATIGFFKTGAPVTVAIMGPAPIGGPSPTPVQTATPTPTPPLSVSLPTDSLDISVPIDTVFLEPVVTTNVDAGLAYVGFQGDFTFDETVVTFVAPFVEAGGLTANNWNVAGNILPGSGPIRTLRVSAFSNDFTPLSGSGLLYNLRMVRVTKQLGASTALTWAANPDDFNYIDTNLDLHAPVQDNGLISITAPTPTPTSTPISTPSPTATPPAETHALNLSTRLLVQGGDDVGIGGFIITGTAPKQVLIRGIGPSLANFQVPNPLANPMLILNGPPPFATITNNNWKDTQQAEIEATFIAPTNDLESAILVTLDPGSYTAILQGQDGGSGVALIEIYDLSQASASKLGNIATRAFVNTGNDIVIAGFILGNGTGSDKVVVRGIGPSLTQFGVPNALANPNLELRNGDGTLLIANDNWQDTPAQAAELTALNLAPTNALESGLIVTLGTGAYTALLSGVGNLTGNALVEVYDNPVAPTPSPTPVPAPQTVALPITNFDTSVPFPAFIVQPVTTTSINVSEGYLGFLGDFIYDPAVVTFAYPPVQKAGLTAGNWQVWALISDGPGGMKTIRVVGESKDSTPLSGSGTLFNLNMHREGTTPGATCPLVWKTAPGNFIFITGNGNNPVPTQPDGLITITTTIPSTPTPTPIPAPQTVGLPIIDVPSSIDGFSQPLATTVINASEGYVGFQGDFTFDETVCRIERVSKAGVTSGTYWNLTGNLLPGPGPIRTLRVRAYSEVFSPLSGSLVLCNLTMQRVSSTLGASSALVWQPAPDNFYFIDSDLNLHKPGQTNGLLTIAGPATTPAPAPQTISLPIANVDTSVPIGSVIVLPLTTTMINASEGYLGFTGDFSYDPTVVTFEQPPAQQAGLTNNSAYYVGGAFLPGPAPIVRITAFSWDSTPLSGSGTLCNLLMRRVSNTPGASSPLIWQPAGNFHFSHVFVPHVPTQTNGLITITGP